MFFVISVLEDDDSLFVDEYDAVTLFKQENFVLKPLKDGVVSEEACIFVTEKIQILKENLRLEEKDVFLFCLHFIIKLG